MTVQLLQDYLNTPAGTIAEYPASTEAELIRLNIAKASTGTPNGTSIDACIGTTSINAGASSVTVTNPNVDTTSKVMAIVAQSTADTTLNGQLRVVCNNGSFTIYGNANATAAVVIDWVLFNGTRGERVIN